jgi:Flp pilus assembly protein TadG
MIGLSRSPARKDRRGQALVEFALVFPILMLMLLGLFDMGRAVFTYNTITNAAREGVRLAIVNQDEAKVELRARNLAPTADGVANPVAVFFSDSGSATDADDCSPIAVGCNATVRYTATFQPITPIVGAIVGPITMSAESVLPVEYVCPNSTTASNACPKQP